MDTEITEQSSENIPVANEGQNLEEIIRKNGYERGKLFYAADKATFTFIHHDEVVSLHFDLKKQGLFLQGHKISFLSDHENLEELLSLFKRELIAHKAPRELMTVFDATLSRLSQSQ